MRQQDDKQREMTFEAELKPKGFTRMSLLPPLVVWIVTIPMLLLLLWVPLTLRNIRVAIVLVELLVLVTTGVNARSTASSLRWQGFLRRP